MDALQAFNMRVWMCVCECKCNSSIDVDSFSVGVGGRAVMCVHLRLMCLWLSVYGCMDLASACTKWAKEFFKNYLDHA